MNYEILYNNEIYVLVDVSKKLDCNGEFPCVYCDLIQVCPTDNINSRCDKNINSVFLSIPHYNKLFKTEIRKEKIKFIFNEI